MSEILLNEFSLRGDDEMDENTFLYQSINMKKIKCVDKPDKFLGAYGSVYVDEFFEPVFN